MSMDEEQDQKTLRNVGALAKFTTEQFGGDPVPAVSALSAVLMEFVKTSDNPPETFEKIVQSMKLLLELPNVFIGPDNSRPLARP